MRQWLRKARVTLSGDGAGFVVNPLDEVAPHEMRIAFEVSKGISGEANSANISIWNLNEDHRNAVGKELDDIQLEAGYMPPEGGGNVGIIFKGQIRDFEHVRKGPDIITKISCGDGDKALRKATIAKTYKKGTKVQEVLEGIQEQLEKEGITKGQWKLPDDVKDFKRPYSMCGSCKRELNTLGRGKRFYWSIQNGTMEIIPSDGHLAGVVLLTYETGLIGTPTITDNGVKATALLNPDIRPNRTVQIKSETLEMNGEDSLYRVSSLDLSGDNLQGDFVVDIHGEAIKGGKVDEGKK